MTGYRIKQTVFMVIGFLVGLYYGLPFADRLIAGRRATSDWYESHAI